TRPEERRRLIGAAQELRFLVLDELHTYRGRQGSDVALLVRRLRDACAAPNLQCIGTSATMVTETSSDQARETVANTASDLFGVPVGADRVIGETLRRATDSVDAGAALLASAVDVAGHAGPPRSFADLVADPLASWIETTFGLTVEEGTRRWVRQRP